jgi:hypothetical protein
VEAASPPFHPFNPNASNIASALALLSSSISQQQQGEGHLPLTLSSLFGSHSNSKAALATPNSLTIASALALLSQTIQSEQQGSPLNASHNASSSSVNNSLLSPNALSLASALALLSSSIEQQQQQWARQSLTPGLPPNTTATTTNTIPSTDGFLSPTHLCDTSTTTTSSSSASSSSQSTVSTAVKETDLSLAARFSDAGTDQDSPSAGLKTLDKSDNHSNIAKEITIDDGSF